MKPHEAAARLEEMARALVAILPPEDHWLPALLLRRLRDPDADLDRMLGLKSRAGGRGGYVGSPLPERDRLIRAFAAQLPGTVKDKATHIAHLAASRSPELGHIARLARIPSLRQLQRILADDK